MDLLLKGKTAIVTDATCDIGKSVAIDLSLEGVELLLCSPNKSKLKKLSEEIKATGGRSSYYCFDGTDKEEVEKAVEEINKKSEKIDILIKFREISRYIFSISETFKFEILFGPRQQLQRLH